MRLLILIVMGEAIATAGAATSSDWLDEPDVQSRLRTGEVAIRAELDEQGQRARIRAAIRLATPAESVWTVLTDCTHAAEFIPGLKRCRCVGQVRWEGCTLVARDIKYSWFMPTVHDVVRAEYAWPRRIDFQLVSGDLREERGTWRLEPAPDAPGTILDYELEVAPKSWWPSRMVEHSMLDNLQLAMKSVRTRLQSQEGRGDRFTAR